MVGNLRGIRESGRIFAVPTYFFIVTTLTLIALGAWHALTGSVHPVTTDDPDAGDDPAVDAASCC